MELNGTRMVTVSLEMVSPNFFVENDRRWMRRFFCWKQPTGVTAGDLITKPLIGVDGCAFCWTLGRLGCGQRGTERRHLLSRLNGTKDLAAVNASA